MSDKKQFALHPLAAAVSAALVPPTAALAQEADDEEAKDGIEEVIVTARKRDENIQDIPASVQAIRDDMLDQLGALNTEDYARMIPSMTWLNFSTAGSNYITFRGITTGTDNFIAQASASVYLDEVSVTQTGSQPDIRMMDINRVEALQGPQGTLYGAAAQAGTLRIYTNQPDLSNTESHVDTSLRAGGESAMSHSVTGVLNMPIVEDVFAIRIAAQTAKDGGFIDNVLGHTPDGWYGYSVSSSERADWGTLDNSHVVEDDWNSVEYLATRIQARWQVNDNWTVTASHNYAKNEAQGANDYNPFVGDLETIAFNKNYRQDEWDLFSLTVEADLGFAQFVSATSFFDREYDYSLDGTVYFKYYHAWGCESRSDAAYYYWLWVNPKTGLAVYYPQYCIMPTAVGGNPYQQGDYLGVLEGPSWNDKFAQELRISSQGETLDWLLGFYYEESSDNWDSVWMKSTSHDYQDSLSLQYFEDRYGQSFPNAEYAFLSTDRTNWQQTAVFGEVIWHLSDELHLTVGARWFQTENDKQYLKYHAGHTGSGGRQVGGALQPISQPGTGGFAVAHSEISEFVPKFTLSYAFDDDKMVYATYTEGFRTGGTNRNNGRADWSRTFFPQTFEPDVVANNEVGVRTQFADGTMQLNASYFYMDWDDFQIEVVDPSGQSCTDEVPVVCGNPWLKVVGNVGDAHTAGFLVEAEWVPADGWDLGANAQWLEAQSDEEIILNARLNSAGEPRAVVTEGLDLPNTPDLQVSAWGSYTWSTSMVPGGQFTLSGSYSYRGESQNRFIPQPESSANPSFTNEAYHWLGARLALWAGEADWQVDVFVNNLTDERADYWHGTGNFEWQFSHSTDYEHYHRVWTNRPREFGVRFAKWWR